MPPCEQDCKVPPKGMFIFKRACSFLDLYFVIIIIALKIVTKVQERNFKTKQLYFKSKIKHQVNNNTKYWNSVKVLSRLKLAKHYQLHSFKTLISKHNPK